MATRTLYPSIAPSLDLNFAGSKTLDPRITFSRASAGTYYDGRTVAKAEENLLTYSQDFGNAVWDKGTGSTISADTLETVAPNGTNTADRIAETATTSSHRAAQSSLSYSSGQFSASVFWKKGTRTWVWLSLQVVSGSNTTTQRQWFNLDTISAGQQVYVQDAGVTSLVSFVSSSIIDVGNGWRRCVITVNGTSATGSITVNTGLADADASLSYAGAVDQYGYLWGAQLEQRSQVTAYTPTTTQPITNYIPVLQTAPAGVPRFDHNPVTGESLGLLVEEQRTNLLPYSEQLDNFNWLKTACTALPNAITAPDGYISADRLVEDSSNASHYIGASTQSVTSGITYTATIYAKASDRTVLQMLPALSAFGAVFANFDLSAGTLGTISGGSASITHVGNNWYRCSFTVTATATVATGPVNFTLQTSATAARAAAYQGNGYSGIYIWGAQLEAGAFATSYIKTEASQVTRAADSASMTGANFSSWYRQDEGTLFLESTNEGGVAGGNFGMSDGTNNNRLWVQSDTRTFTTAAYVMKDSVLQSSLSVPGIAVNTSSKIAMAYRANDLAATRLGFSPVTDNTALIPIVNKALFNAIGSENAASSSGWIRRAAYYPKRLTDAQLQALTL